MLLKVMKQPSLRADPWKPTRTGNRWFTGLGKRKRVPEDWKPLQPLALELKSAILQSPKLDIVEITVAMKKKYQCSFVEAVERSIAFVGLFDNERLMPIFTKDRYLAGCRHFGIVVPRGTLKKG